MAQLRALAIVLILLNLLAFAALQGWLGGAAPRGEPERLTNQLNPERIQLRPRPPARAEANSAKVAPLPAEAVPAASIPPPAAESAAEPEACLAFAALNPEAARRLADSVAAQAEFKLRDLPTEVPNSWWVNLPPADSKEAAEARAAELRKLGVTDLFVMREAGPNQFAVSLGLYKQEAQAQRLLGELQAMGVREARVTARGTTTHRIEIRGRPERLAALAGELKGLPAAARAACQP